jgi:hypothetical protein
LDSEQKRALETPFSPQELRQREGHNGQVFDYIEAHAVIGRLNQALRSNWSFEITEHQVREDLDEAIVLGRLTTSGISKTQFGSSRLSREREGGVLICLGDDLKAAASDALKKCATLLGVGLHLYGTTPNGRPCDTQSEEMLPGPPPQVTQSTHAQHGEARPTQARLSQKQRHLIGKVAAEHQLTTDDLNSYSQRHYGAPIEELTKVQASQLIDSLMDRKVQAA